MLVGIDPLTVIVLAETGAVTLTPTNEPELAPAIFRLPVALILPLTITPAVDAELAEATPAVIAPVVALIDPLVLSIDTLLAVIALGTVITPPFASIATLTNPVPVVVPVIAAVVIAEPEVVVVRLMLALVEEALAILNIPDCVIEPLAVKLIDGVFDAVPVNVIPLVAVPTINVPVIFADTLPAPLIALLIVVALPEVKSTFAPLLNTTGLLPKVAVVVPNVLLAPICNVPPVTFVLATL